MDRLPLVLRSSRYRFLSVASRESSSGCEKAGILVPDHLLLPVIRHQQTARVVLRTPVECQSNVVTPHDLVRGLLTVLQPVNLLSRNAVNVSGEPWTKAMVRIVKFVTIWSS